MVKLNDIEKKLQNYQKGVEYNVSYENTLNLDIAKFCPNLKSLHTTFKKDEIRTLMQIRTNLINKTLKNVRFACSK